MACTITSYVEIVREYFPTVEVTCSGDPGVYANLNWVSTVIAEADLQTAHLAEHKTNKIIEFSEMAREDIINGFTSSSLGAPHSYDSEPEDQLNLIGSVTANVTMPYSCRAYTQGTQVIDLGGAKVGTDATGYANDTTMYSLEVQADGVSSYLSIAGEDAQTIDTLITAINADADFLAIAVAELDSGNIKISSLTYGNTSTVNIITGSLVTSLTGFVELSTAVDGITGEDNVKAYQIHTNAQLQTVLNDGAVVKLTVLQKFNTKKDQIILAVDCDAVDAITWD